MARITIEDCLKRVPNRFVIVNLAARRVREIREGSEYLVSSPKNEDIVVALREIAAGKVMPKREGDVAADIKTDAKADAKADVPADPERETPTEEDAPLDASPAVEETAESAEAASEDAASPADDAPEETA